MFIIFAYFCFLFFIYKRLLFVSLFFQQKEYSLVQFLKFIFYKFQLIDKRLSIVLFLYTIPAVRMPNLNIDMFVLSNLFVLFAFLTPNVLKGVVKKKLDLTNKLVIILLGTFVLCFSFSLSLFEYIYILNLNNVYCFCNYVGFLIFVVQIIPFLLLLSTIFFLPLEIFIKYIYVRKAKKKLLLKIF